jgi:hypothetical protein
LSRESTSPRLVSLGPSILTGRSWRAWVSHGVNDHILHVIKDFIVLGRPIPGRGLLDEFGQGRHLYSEVFDLFQMVVSETEKALNCFSVHRSCPVLDCLNMIVADRDLESGDFVAQRMQFSKGKSAFWQRESKASWGEPESVPMVPPRRPLAVARPTTTNTSRTRSVEEQFGIPLEPVDYPPPPYSVATSGASCPTRRNGFMEHHAGFAFDFSSLSCLLFV